MMYRTKRQGLTQFFLLSGRLFYSFSCSLFFLALFAVVHIEQNAELVRA